MSQMPTAVQVRQWSEQVARDPGSLFFLPLAEAYRAHGLRDSALRLCLRGLEQHPNHVGAHYLLGLLYREGDDPVRALDEWDITLRLDPDHSRARRELGLLHAAREEWDAALRHLQASARRDPADTEVTTALALAYEHRFTPYPIAEPIRPAYDEQPSAPAAAAERSGPFYDLMRAPDLIGAVLVDGQGLALAGEIRTETGDRAAEVAAALRGISGDAEHAVRHLELGAWNSMLLESAHTVVHLTPAGDALLAVAAPRTQPAGWTIRLASRIRRAADELLSVTKPGRGAA
jgi:predicted regulator of Ras-like GTPase activity (Roadblock/LC7/MglB family)